MREILQMAKQELLGYVATHEEDILQKLLYAYRDDKLTEHKMVAGIASIYELRRLIDRIEKELRKEEDN